MERLHLAAGEGEATPDLFYTHDHAEIRGLIPGLHRRGERPAELRIDDLVDVLGSPFPSGHVRNQSSWANWTSEDGEVIYVIHYDPADGIVKSLDIQFRSGPLPAQFQKL